MAVRNVLRMGDPRLLQPAEAVGEFDTPALHALVTDLLDTMASEDGAGLAATQIGVGVRVVVFGCEHNPRYPEAPPVPQTVLVNPLVQPLSGEMDEAWEGCLSIPGLRGLVPRYTHIRYTGYAPSGRPIEREAEGFHARVVQHECDHLDGILYPHRMRDMTKFGFIEELHRAGSLGSGSLPCEDDRRSAAE